MRTTVPPVDSKVWADIYGQCTFDGPFRVQGHYTAEGEEIRPVTMINYAPEYKELMSLFWTVYEANECSERVFHLTTRIIELCEGHYTVWQYRRKLLRELKMDLKKELIFVRQYTVERPKNYQLWRHREVVVSMMEEDPELLRWEREDLELVLLEDPKNYHAWQYRWWLARRFNDWQDELAFTKAALLRDPYNNSAWNYRYYAITAGIGKDAVDWDQEASLVTSLSNPQNVAVLNYSNAIRPFLKI